jgi:hypothetical protein
MTETTSRQRVHRIYRTLSLVVAAAVILFAMRGLLT